MAIMANRKEEHFHYARKRAIELIFGSLSVAQQYVDNKEPKQAVNAA